MYVNWEIVGAISTLVGSLGTVGAFICAFIQINNERKIRRESEKRKIEAERKQQAEKVSAWLGGSDYEKDETIYYLLNQSSEPVYQVVITVIGIQGAGFPFDGKKIDEEYGSAYRQYLSILPPGEYKVINRKSLEYSMQMRFGLEIAFKDAHGHNWVRMGNGDLKEIDVDPLCYYNVSLPVNWTTPTKI